MAKQWTHQDVHDVLQAAWENDIPDRVIQVLRPHYGKPITTRLVKALQTCDDPRVAACSWRLERAYGMTHLKTREYDRGEWQTGKAFSFLLDWTEAAVPLDVDAIKERNPAYFSARVSRNHTRMEAMNTKATLDSMAMALTMAERALEELATVKGLIEGLTEYGGPFYADKYTFERLCGLREDK